MLDTCNDASGNEQRNPKYLAPPRTLPVQGLSVEAVGSIRVTDEAVAQNERIFHRVGQGWIYASPNHIFTSEDLRKGLKLGVDARDVRRLGGWDGRATETSLRRMVDLASPDCSALEAMTESRI